MQDYSSLQTHPPPAFYLFLTYKAASHCGFHPHAYNTRSTPVPPDQWAQHSLNLYATRPIGTSVPPLTLTALTQPQRHLTNRHSSSTPQHLQHSLNPHTYSTHSTPVPPDQWAQQFLPRRKQRRLLQRAPGALYVRPNPSAPKQRQASGGDTGNGMHTRIPEGVCSGSPPTLRTTLCMQWTSAPTRMRRRKRFKEQVCRASCAIVG